MITPKLLRLGVANGMGHSRPTLQACLEAALSIADGLVDDLFAGMDDALERETEESVWTVHPDAVRQLLQQAPEARATFLRHLRHALYHGGDAGGVSSEHVRFDALRLFDAQQIDATIGLALVEREFARASADVLPRLNALISSLMGWLSVRPELNPLRPEAFAQALQEVLERHVDDTGARNALYLPAAEMAGRSLRQLYKELVEWLLVNQVEPMEAPAQRLARSQEPRTAMGRTLLTLGRLHQLLVGQLGSEAGLGPGQEFQHTVPVSMVALEDMGLVEPMMQRLRARASRAEPADEVAGAEEQKLGRLLGLEVVRLMLDQLRRDERLLPAIREQIGLLEPLLCRLADADPRFFSERAHPARRLLEAITQRSLGFLSTSDEGYADTLRSVIATVNGLQDGAADEACFAQAVHELQARWAEDDARKNVMRAEAARALLHAEQRHLLAERLASDFERRVQDQDVPAFVRDFLRGPWAQAVAETRLDGERAAADEPPVGEVADDLIWSVQPRLTRHDRTRLVRLVPRLLSQLRHGLQRIAFPPERTAAFFDALVQWHEQAFERPAGAWVGVAPRVADQDAPSLAGPGAEATVDGVLEEPAFWMAGREAQDAGYLSEELAPDLSVEREPGLADLVPGAWVDLLVDGERVRAQLTWAQPAGHVVHVRFSQWAGAFHDAAHAGPAPRHGCAAPGVAR